jgi:hypothetical protein
MKKTYLILLLLGFVNIYGYSKPDENNSLKSDYLTFQTGFILDEYSSLGVRMFFEYQKDIKKNFQYGISYDHSRHMGYFMTESRFGPSNLSVLSLNGYYKLNLIKDKLFWTCGLGVGALHLYWDDNDSFGATVNASITLNIRITKRVYLESSPLTLLLTPVNRYYYSPMNIGHFDTFSAFTLFPFGLKVKL